MNLRILSNLNDSMKRTPRAAGAPGALGYRSQRCQCGTVGVSVATQSGTRPSLGIFHDPTPQQQPPAGHEAPTSPGSAGAARAGAEAAGALSGRAPPVATAQGGRSGLGHRLALPGQLLPAALGARLRALAAAPVPVPGSGSGSAAAPGPGSSGDSGSSGPPWPGAARTRSAAFSAGAGGGVQPSRGYRGYRGYRGTGGAGSPLSAPPAAACAPQDAEPGAHRDAEEAAVVGRVRRVPSAAGARVPRPAAALRPRPGPHRPHPVPGGFRASVSPVPVPPGYRPGTARAAPRSRCAPRTAPGSATESPARLCPFVVCGVVCFFCNK